ncbi:MAG: hypothetical protein CBE33_03535 [Candidatus Pelagibacter sp. TMED273]|nr:MAG: hypothetical protein CBE33_03535 [Candidatus Pelagibacter sp. TMED273]|tara:strand:+ start:2474 stop:2719 length:246 start_codon:yes stop_codon:yes gene_type:complete
MESMATKPIHIWGIRSHNFNYRCIGKQIMILYTEAQLKIAYTRYVRKLGESKVKVMVPTIEEFRKIYEAELEDKLWDLLDD